MKKSSNKSASVIIPKELLSSFILVTILFSLWGFANDITNPMVAAFKNILLLSNFESSLVQAAFYGGYALMAIPAAIFIKRFSYKKGILIGLALYATGCLLFIPSGWSMSFASFLLAYLIMTCGLSFLETTANPYVLSMGDEATATRRLNLAQAFNPLGSISGMFVASMIILVNLNSTTESGRRYLQNASDGNPITTQVLKSQIDTAKQLDLIFAENNWATNKKWLKKAQELAINLSNHLSLLADPKPKQALALQKTIANQPRENKFKAALKAVAVVLQIREPLLPSQAENQRDNIFHGNNGLELAVMLGEEQALLGNLPEFSNLLSSLQAATAPARLLSEKLPLMYTTLAGDSQQIEGATLCLSQVRSALQKTESSMETLQTRSLQAYFTKSGQQLKAIQKKDISIVVTPYALMGGFLILMLALFTWKLPSDVEHEGSARLDIIGTLKRLFHNARYIEGVIAQTFYVGAQIMCWTFIIQYAEKELGLSKSTAQNCNILAMLIFVTNRFICTFLLHYIKPGALLGLLAGGGLILTTGTIFVTGYAGLYCLIGVSACMSLMFPTIYGIALKGLGDDAKLASAGLILAIGGGCLMPPLQAAIIDMPPFDLGFMELASVRVSFILPLICFAVIAHYGWKTYRVHLR